MSLRRSSKRSAPDQDADVCWVCLDAEDDERGELVSPCNCPRSVHPVCLARWQLRSAGKGEETHCRFCSAQLPDWRESMTPTAAKEVQRCGAAPPAIMAVAFNGQTHEVEVEPGPEGFAKFQNRVRELFGINDELQMDLTFDCAEPATGQPLQLAGSGAFNAAVHCAAMAAASRARKRLRRSATGRRLLPSFLGRSASCACVMDSCSATGGGSTMAPDDAGLETMSSAASATSIPALVAESGAQVAVHQQQRTPQGPAALPRLPQLVLPKQYATFDVQSMSADNEDTLAAAPASSSALPRWDLSPDVQRSISQWTRRL